MVSYTYVAVGNKSPTIFYRQLRRDDRAANKSAPGLKRRGQIAALAVHVHATGFEVGSDKRIRAGGVQQSPIFNFNLRPRATA